MNVFSNFWNVLTMENEMVTKIVTAPTVFVEAWLVFNILSSILKFNFTKNRALLCIILLSLNSLMTEFLIPTPYNVLINYMMMFIILKLNFHTNTIKTALFILVPTIIFALIGLLILKPILLIFNISSTQAQYTPIYKLTYLLTTYIITFILIKIFNKLNFHISFNEDFYKSNWKIIFVNLLLGFITISIELIITSFYTDSLPFGITFLDFLSLFAYFFTSFYSLIKTMKLQIATKSLENAENYNKTLSILYDNVRAFKHDFDNMIFIIGGFINTDDMDGLKKYYSSLEKDCQNVNNISLLNPKLINNPGIYNLLTTKYQSAQNENIEKQLDFFFDLNKLHMPIYDFSRMLGIFLDNSIEAATLSNDKIIKITFRDSTTSNTQIIQIENSYTNKTVDTQDIFKKGITEKPNHLGMGLWEVKQILKRNNNVNLITEKNDIYFKQRLEIYY